MSWEITIGLEVHVQLATRTKLFCRCETRFGDPANTRVCPVCLGHPGVLPVANEEAIQQGARAALALGMTVNADSKFDRKNYFYPDLPKGYQISQFDEPIGSDGVIELDNGKRIEIERLHLEEDAGKAIHDRGPFGLVDYNRAGTPLAEIVSRPDIASAAEAREYLEKLKQMLRYAGVSDCDMEKGNLRVDVNLSIAPHGQRATGTRAEIKNVNSFNSVVRSAEFEANRQIALLESGGTVAQETRSWDEAGQVTRTMRSKEEAEDYRYFPEPDLPRLQLDPAAIEAWRAALPEPASSRRARYESDYSLSSYDAGVLTAERETSDYFEAVIADGVTPKEAANWISNTLLARIEPGDSVADLPVDPSFLSGSLALLSDRRTNRNGVTALIDARLSGASESPAELLESLGLEIKSDAGELEAICNSAIEQNAQAADDVRNGKDKAIGALLGAVMKASRGAADPQVTREILLRLLERAD